VLKDAFLSPGVALSGMRGCSLLAPDPVQNGEGSQASYPAHPSVLGKGQNSTMEQDGDTETSWSGTGGPREWWTFEEPSAEYLRTLCEDIS
jgi:hypothetical protein